MTSLDGINGRSIQTLLRGENDSKQSDEFQANSGEPFRKDAFSVTVSSEYVPTVGQTGEKNPRFQTKTDTCGRGYDEFHKEGYA